ncbi:hypothetical protein M409DRAFT_38284 [Zasmidium cellare ATCC 36951]|uniref:MmgE/PrpD family protein n=1 Tax=Zasmidium cellare ATCC 36951 TaxID=1080233 RepID=A0A6A6BWN0_ZASCE|nr:uncharacterized protein M409DRAFT_38284 [Zasmidium cellare ATCC 36951]KAF2158370.1 hypothetical protein M409DRAFT_38284 [Zasmidium cellare ATCC 36951]
MDQSDGRPDESLASMTRTARLTQWAAALSYDEIPSAVIEQTKLLFLDWLGCCVAGRSHASVQSMLHFAQTMGPKEGRSELVSFAGVTTSPYFAAMVNGASSHVVEQDDLHNSSMIHPATVVFPAALAVAQDVGCSGSDFLKACVIGYEFACRAGECLGKEHYKAFHSTATAGVLGAAAATTCLLKGTSPVYLSALGTAGTQAAGLWQFLLDATHSKQVHTARACSNGVYAAYVATCGLLGPTDIIEGEKGMIAMLSARNARPEFLDSKLGQKWAVMESSFKWHASCRHTHAAIDAFLALIEEFSIGWGDIEQVKAYTYDLAISIMSLSEKAETVHQSKFSMGFVLAVAAKHGQAMITDFTEQALEDTELRDFQRRVEMVLDAEIDSLFPEHWTSRIEVTTKTGSVFSKSVDAAKGDPQWSLTRDEIETKFRALVEYGGEKNMDFVDEIINKVRRLETEADIHGFAFV